MQPREPSADRPQSHKGPLEESEFQFEASIEAPSPHLRTSWPRPLASPLPCPSRQARGRHTDTGGLFILTLRRLYSGTPVQYVRNAEAETSEACRWTTSRHGIRTCHLGWMLCHPNGWSRAPIDGRAELQNGHYGTFGATAQHSRAHQTRANIIIKDSAVYYLVNDQITNVQPIKFKLALQYIVPTSSISPSATTAFKSGGLQHEIIHQHVAGRNCCMWEEDN
jgi:hypothetical protein